MVYFTVYIYIYIHMIYWKSLEKTPKLQCVFLFSILFNKKHFWAVWLHFFYGIFGSPGWISLSQFRSCGKWRFLVSWHVKIWCSERKLPNRTKIFLLINTNHRFDNFFNFNINPLPATSFCSCLSYASRISSSQRVTQAGGRFRPTWPSKAQGGGIGHGDFLLPSQKRYGDYK